MTIRSPTIDVITAHRSVRGFRSDPLPEGFLETLKEVMRRGPTSSALQTYTVVLVRDGDLRRRLRPHAGGQPFLEECPLLLVGCADLRRVKEATEARAYPYRAADLRILISAVEDLTIAVQNASLSAQSLGLGTVMVGGVLNGTREIHALLRLPPRVVPLLGLCIGYPTPEHQDLPERPRLPSRVVFHDDHYTLAEEDERALLAGHDEEVVERSYYRGRRIPLSAVDPGTAHDPVADDAYGWTEHVARKQSRHWWTTASPKLFDDLAALGLDLFPSTPERSEV